MNTSYYDSKPLTYEAIGNGSYFYRWNIQEVEINNIEDIVEPKWSCYEVVIWNTVTKDKITEAVINTIWGNGIEEKMLNDYNASQLGILDESYINKYKQFLMDRKKIKDDIKAVCEQFNIQQ